MLYFIAFVLVYGLLTILAVYYHPGRHIHKRVK